MSQGVCDVCQMRPKMDRCACCEECWYSGRYADWQAWNALSPAEQHRAFARELQRWDAYDHG